jgi:glyoxylase-like metal-dependent hydrolase (beta-lactamase superfamily II)
MEKKKKFIVIAVAIAIVLTVIIIAAINVGPMLFMKPSETGEFSNTSIYILNSGINNMFLINSSEGYIVIDTGSDVEAIQEELKKLKINESDIKHVFLTHTDYDHVAGLSLFKNAKIYMSEDVLQTNGSKKVLYERNSLDDKVTVEDVNLLSDEKLTLENVTIKSIKAPGHTPGHMIYLVNDTYLFSGDAMEISGNTIKQHPFTMDEEKSSESIKTIKNIMKNIDYVFTAHYGYYKAENLNLN